MHREYVERLINCLENIVISSEDGAVCTDYEEGVAVLMDLFEQVKQSGKQLFFVGNGGSAAIASHMTADFMKNGGMKTYSLYDNSVTTCMGNDYGYEHIFSYPLGFLANEGDLLVAISSSGNSQNIVNTIEVAKKKQMKIITLSGFEKDNRINGQGTWNIYVPVSQYGIVESIHNLLLQQIVDSIMERDGVCL